MSRLVYPPDGIYGRCRSAIENSRSDISAAISNCIFDIPADFPHKNYLNSLSDTLQKYHQDINTIDLKIRDIDKSFSNLSENLTNRAKRIVSSKILKRERLIK